MSRSSETIWDCCPLKSSKEHSTLGMDKPEDSSLFLFWKWMEDDSLMVDKCTQHQERKRERERLLAIITTGNGESKFKRHRVFFEFAANTVSNDVSSHQYSGSRRRTNSQGRSSTILQRYSDDDATGMLFPASVFAGVNTN